MKGARTVRRGQGTGDRPALPYFQNDEVVSVLYLRRETVKGKHEGSALTLPRGARKALLNYLQWKRAEKESLGRNAPLFVSRNGVRLSRKQAHKIFKAAYQKVGLKGHVTTHSPRVRIDGVPKQQ